MKFSEKKIDRIEGRLGNIEVLLKTLANSGSSPAGHVQYSTPQSGGSVATGVPTNEDESDHESAYGGDNALNTHAAFASEFLASAVRTTSLRDIDPRVEASLINLHQLVDMQKQRSISHGPRFPLAKPLPPGGLRAMPMPPISVVSPMLQRSNSKI